VKGACRILPSDSWLNKYTKYLRRNPLGPSGGGVMLLRESFLRCFVGPAGQYVVYRVMMVHVMVLFAVSMVCHPSLGFPRA
jgi:hypothetical protein